MFWLTAVDCVEKLDLVSLRGQRGGGPLQLSCWIKMAYFCC